MIKDIIIHKSLCAIAGPLNAVHETLAGKEKL